MVIYHNKESNKIVLITCLLSSNNFDLLTKYPNIYDVHCIQYLKLMKLTFLGKESKKLS